MPAIRDAHLRYRTRASLPRRPEDESRTAKLEAYVQIAARLDPHPERLVIMRFHSSLAPRSGSPRSRRALQRVRQQKDSEEPRAAPDLICPIREETRNFS